MTANLPDNVTAVTRFTIDQGDDAGEIYVEQGDESVWIRQDDDTVLVRVDALPGLIAALQAAAGIQATGDHPAFVIDNDGDRWERNADGLYCMRSGRTGELYGDFRPLAYIRRNYGIRGEE